MTELLTWASDHVVLAVAGAVLAVVTVIATVYGAARLTRAVVRRVRPNPAGALTVVAAGIATAVAASGMWQFFARIMPGLPWPWRVALFAFIEIAVVTSAVRARENMRTNYRAGLDGKAVWILTSLSAVLSALESSSLPEAVFRLAAPLVAAWLWERGMAIERARLTDRSRINWRVTPERVFVRLGLAEAADRSASEVDTHRRITRVALAAFRVRQLDPGTRRHGRALRALNRATAAAVEHADLTAPERSTALLDQLGALYGAPRLAQITPPAPWDDVRDAVEVEQIIASFGSPRPDEDPNPGGPDGPDRLDMIDSPTAVRLKALPRDADRIRAALAELGPSADARQITAWLADHGVQVSLDNARSVMRRDRSQQAAIARVIRPLRSKTSDQ